MRQHSGQSRPASGEPLAPPLDAAVSPWTGFPGAMSLAIAAEGAREYLAASRAANTHRSYRTGWRQFETWCEQRHLTPLPASSETVALYVVDLVAGNVTTATGSSTKAKPATIDTRLAAIGAAHRAAGYESPARAEAVRMVRRGIRRTVGTAQRQVRPVSVRDLQMMMEGFRPGSAADCRDRALLLIGYAGALRRSELVGLDVGDVVEGANGLTVTIRRSKTDQEGVGRTVGIPYGRKRPTCPVRAWRTWLIIAGISEGPAFRPVRRSGQVGAARLSSQSIARIVKRHASAAGLDPRQVAAHSLRAGLATSAAAAGVPERVIANTTGHKGTTMLRKYIREGSLFRENAAAAVGL